MSKSGVRPIRRCGLIAGKYGSRTSIQRRIFITITVIITCIWLLTLIFNNMGNLISTAEDLFTWRTLIIFMVFGMAYYVDHKWNWKQEITFSVKYIFLQIINKNLPVGHFTYSGNTRSMIKPTTLCTILQAVDHPTLNRWPIVRNSNGVDSLQIVKATLFSTMMGFL